MADKVHRSAETVAALAEAVRLALLASDKMAQTTPPAEARAVVDLMADLLPPETVVEEQETVILVLPAELVVKAHPDQAVGLTAYRVQTAQPEVVGAAVILMALAETVDATLPSMLLTALAVEAALAVQDSLTSEQLQEMEARMEEVGEVLAKAKQRRVASEDKA